MIVQRQESRGSVFAQLKLAEITARDTFLEIYNVANLSLAYLKEPRFPAVRER